MDAKEKYDKVKRSVSTMILGERGHTYLLRQKMAHGWIPE